MPDLTRWTGTVWGETTKGATFAEITRDGENIQGRITLIEPGFGQLSANMKGVWSSGNKLTAELNQFEGKYSIQVILPQTGIMTGTFDPAEETLLGEWKTDTKTDGKFMMVKTESLPAEATVPQNSQPAPSATNNTATSPQNVPPLVTKTVVLSSYRFDERAVRRLVDIVKSGTNVLNPAINASHNGSEHIHIGVDNLIADPAVPNVFYNLLVTANEQSINTGTNTVTVNLKQDENNILFVSGYNQVWVEGKAAQVLSFLKEHESRSAYVAKKYGGTINSIIFLGLLAVLPSIPSMGRRVIVVVFAFLLLLLLMYSWRLAVNTKIFLREAKTAWYERNAGLLLVILEVALTAWVGYLIHLFLPSYK